MIIRRYIISEIIKPASNILFLMVVIFASYSAIKYFTEADGSMASPLLVGSLIGLRIGMALEILLPTTLYLSVIIALGRLYKDSEMTALAACGLGRGGIIWPVLLLAIPVSLTAGSASLFLRAEAYRQIYAMRSEVRAEFEIAQLEANRFHEFADGRYTFFSEEIDRDSGMARKVFIREKTNHARKIIQAEDMIDGGRNQSGFPVMILRNGYLVDFPVSGKSGKIMHFEQAHYPIVTDPAAAGRYRRKAATTAHLLGSDRLEDVAELQWRLSTPLSTILLALLGIPLSCTNPRKGKYAKLGTAMIIFATYYQLFAIAKTQVEKGTISPTIGIWWVPVLLSALIIFMFWYSAREEA